MNHRYSTRKMIDVHRHRRKNSHQMKRLFLVNRRRQRSNPAIGWTYGGWWAILSRPFGYYYQFGGHRSRRVWCYHGVIEAVLGRKCRLSFVARTRFAFCCLISRQKVGILKIRYEAYINVRRRYFFMIQYNLSC